MLRRLGLAVFCLFLLNFPALLRAGGEQIRVRALAWNMDGVWLAAGWRDNRLDVFQPEDGGSSEAILSTTLDSTPALIAWDPIIRTRFAVTTADGITTIFDMADGALEVLATLPYTHDSDAFQYKLAWSSDGSWLAVLHIFEGIDVWNVETGELHAHYPIPYAFVDIAWSPRDSDLLLIASWEAEAGGALVLWDAAQQAAVWEAPDPSSLAMWIGWNPAGDRFISAQSGGFYSEARIRLHDVLDGSVLSEFSSPQTAEPAVLWSPLEYLVLSECNFGADGGLKLEIWDIAGDGLQLYLDLPASECAFAISPDNDLAYSDGEVKIMRFDLS